MLFRTTQPLTSFGTSSAAPYGHGQTLSARAVGHAIQTATLIEAMLEKIAAVGSNRRRTERLPALKQPHMPSSTLSLCSASNPVPPSELAPGSTNREFFARFLLDTHHL